MKRRPQDAQLFKMVRVRDRVVHYGPYRFDDGEITEARLVTPAELATLWSEQRFLPGSVSMILPLIEGFTDPGPADSARAD